MKRNSAELFPDEAAILARARRLAAEGGAVSAEDYSRLVDNYETLLFQTAKLVRLSDGTQRKLRKAQRALANSMQARSLFMASLSHEMRNALAGISAMCQMIKMSESRSSCHEDADDIAATCDSVLLLLNDALDHARIEAGHVAIESIPFDPREVVRSALRLVEFRARERGLELEGAVAHDVPRRVAGDAHRLRQVLLNLLSNAVKFTSTGRVCLGMRAEERPDGSLLLHVEVRDTGVGIGPTALRQVFTPYRQGAASIARRYGGSGLGLSICKKLVKLMGGSIGVESEPGQGSRFFFHICVMPAREEARSGKDGAGSDTQLNARVLVADDNAVSRLLLERQLTALGCEPAACFEDGMQVLDYLEGQVGGTKGTGAVDGLLLDVEMPRLNGLETARRIRRLETKGRRFTADGLPLVIIAMTAHPESEIRPICRDAGIEGYLFKPVKFDLLREELARCLRFAGALPDGS